MSARASLTFELGMRTSSCMAMLAFRMRVSMSEMGSVIVIGRLPSPAGLRHAGDLTGVHHLAEAHAAEAELAVHGVRAPAALAPGVSAHLELRRALLLLDECLLGHQSCPSRLNGKPKASRRALPSASVLAVVTIVMSIPRGASIES